MRDLERDRERCVAHMTGTPKNPGAGPGHSLGPAPATTMRFYAHARPVERVGASDKLAALTRGEVMPMPRLDGNKMETSDRNAAEEGSATP